MPVWLLGCGGLQLCCPVGLGFWAVAGETKLEAAGAIGNWGRLSKAFLGSACPGGVQAEKEE